LQLVRHKDCSVILVKQWYQLYAGKYL
jgi:hypothetical protein